MSTPSSAHNSVPEPASTIQDHYSWSAILLGLLPLTVLVVTIAATLIIVAVTRRSIPSSAFAMQQQADLMILLSGSLIAFISSALAILFLQRRMTLWQRQGFVRRARMTLWLLVATAVLIILPVIIAVLLPQQPAP